MNAAIILSHAIFDSVLSAKVQYIGPAMDIYKAGRERYLKELSSSHSVGEKSVSFNLHRFPELPIAVEQLQLLVLQQGSIQALRAVVRLVEYGGLLREAIDLRNEYIGKFERKEFSIGFTYPEMYFGLATKDGCHQQFSSTMDAIEMYGDNIVYFSRRLCECLSQYGGILKKELKKISSEPVGIVEFDFKKLGREGLCPPPAGYKGWEESFVEVHRRPRWWRRLID
ncbi:hypothetical protein BGP85_00010 [Pseudomonas putida]|nr:hypothetical protein BGP85_00010 [Pseudomonas putida]